MHCTYTHVLYNMMRLVNRNDTYIHHGIYIYILQHAECEGSRLNIRIHMYTTPSQHNQCINSMLFPPTIVPPITNAYCIHIYYALSPSVSDLVYTT